MKKLLLILLCLPMIGFGQKTYVPDDNFETYLEANGMGDGIALNDSVFTSNINTINLLIVENQNISDLTGIEDFIGLDTLSCAMNNLTSLNVSNNTSLRDLRCWGNQLAILDVSNNTALTNLNCESNQLTSLDVNQNTSLIDLICGGNQLTTLDVSTNLNLEILSCPSNQLTSLNVTQNLALDLLGCSNNQLTTLDVNGANALTLLYCTQNQLTILDVSGANVLRNLKCADNQLTSLDVRNGNNTNFTYLVTTNNPNLFCIEADNAQSFDIFADTDPQHYFGNDCSQTYVPDDNFEQVLINLGYDNILDDYVTTESIDTVKSLLLYSQGISDLTGIQAFSDLISLSCDMNSLTNLNVSHNIALTELRCDNNQLWSLDVRNGNNINFTDFFAANNPNLLCIDVDNEGWSNANWTNIDAWTIFDNDCDITSIKEYTRNKKLLKVIDLLGIETKNINQPLLYLYDDGTVEKRIILE